MTVRFFFPDSQDLVDPSFDFETEQRSEHRVRHRDDPYAHEFFAEPPLDGLLVSKAIIDGTAAGAGKYTDPQRQRFYREGVRRFLRIDSPRFDSIRVMGDCGAFAYIKEKVPPISVQEAVEFYEHCGFDCGVSVDHIILGYDGNAENGLPGILEPREDWKYRQEISLQYAAEFLDEHRRVGASFQPIGSAQGWSPQSYATAVNELQRMGYRWIGLGGLVSVKTPDILECLSALSDILQPDTGLHLFGITRRDLLRDATALDVVSVDGTSPLKQAFKDDKNNYHTETYNYVAVRIPQVQGNNALMRAIRAGDIDGGTARDAEQTCLRNIALYDQHKLDIDTVLESIDRYDRICGGNGARIPNYRKTLEDRPWEECPCEVCRQLGIQVILFRGAERNRRRGFHNLQLFYKWLSSTRTPPIATVS